MTVLRNKRALAMGWITTIGLGYGALVGIMFLFQRSLIYHPDPSIIEPAQTGVPEMRVVQVLTGFSISTWERVRLNMY